jgi:dihydroflavonol-4-reductase
MKPIAVITGANGFVGSHLAEYLLSKNYEVHAIVRRSSNMQWIQDLPIEIHPIGIENIETLRPVLAQADYIYHIAGVVKAKDWDGYYHGNVTTTKNILEAAIGNQKLKRIIVTASLACSAPTVPGNPVNEETPSNPLTFYGKSKLEQENLTLSYKDILPVTVLRPPVVFGERDTEVFLFFKTMKMGLFPSLGFDEKTLSLIYIKDLVRGMEMAATAEKSKGQCYFLGGEKNEYTWKEMAALTSKFLDKKYIRLRVPHFMVHIVAHISEWIAKLTGDTATINTQKANEMVQASWSCSSAKAYRDFGYKAEYSLEGAIKNTIDWCKKMKWL